MAISGHKTRSVFDRYNVVSERDLKEAARRLSKFLGEKSGRHSRWPMPHRSRQEALFKEGRLGVAPHLFFLDIFLSGAFLKATPTALLLHALAGACFAVGGPIGGLGRWLFLSSATRLTSLATDTEFRLLATAGHAGIRTSPATLRSDINTSPASLRFDILTSPASLRFDILTSPAARRFDFLTSPAALALLSRGWS